MAAVTSTARQKALSLNLDQRTYGTLARIERGDPSWERLVPPAVADIIKAKKLFGWAEASGPACRVQRRSAGDAG
jgi:hypothetical protein